MDAAEYVREQLFSMQDLKYKEFHCKLMPTVPPEIVIGVRTPQLRRFSKEYAKSRDAAEFLRTLPHKYYEENNLHGFLIEKIKDYDEAVAALDEFLPFIDNWATCDFISPKVFSKHLSELYGKIGEWISSGDTYTVRFAVGMLMKFYLDDGFFPETLELVSSIRSEEYYVNMMVAWYFATALAKQYDFALPYITSLRLATWTHNKAIQKAVESCRISNATKEYLRTLKIKQ